MWIVGAIIAAAGVQVYIIWGIVRDPAFYYLPILNHFPLEALLFNSGEKNHLEYLLPKQRRLIISMYAANAILLGTSFPGSARSLLIFNSMGRRQLARIC